VAVFSRVPTEFISSVAVATCMPSSKPFAATAMSLTRFAAFVATSISMTTSWLVSVALPPACVECTVDADVTMLASAAVVASTLSGSGSERAPLPDRVSSRMPENSWLPLLELSATADRAARVVNGSPKLDTDATTSRRAASLTYSASSTTSTSVTAALEEPSVSLASALIITVPGVESRTFCRVSLRE